MVSYCESHVQKATIHSASKSIISLFRQTVMDVVIDQKVFVRKDSFRLIPADAMSFFAFSRVTFVPLKADYFAEVNYRSHLPVKLQGFSPAFNPPGIVLRSVKAVENIQIPRYTRRK